MYSVCVQVDLPAVVCTIFLSLDCSTLSVRCNNELQDTAVHTGVMVLAAVILSAVICKLYSFRLFHTKCKV